MHEYFYFGTELLNFLFEGVNISTRSAFIGLCIGISLISAGTEGLRVICSYFARLNYRPSSSRSEPCSNERGAATPDRAESPPLGRSSSVQALMEDSVKNGSAQFNLRPLCIVLQTLVHSLYSTIGYILMLVIMSFNTYLFIAVILGIGLGYYICAPLDFMLSSKANPYLSHTASGGLGSVVRVERCASSACQLKSGTQGSREMAAACSLDVTKCEYPAVNTTYSEDSPNNTRDSIAGLLSEELTVDVHQ